MNKRGIEIKLLNKNYFDQIIKEEHYLHRGNTLRPNICYGFYFNDLLVALQEWSVTWKMVLLKFPFLQHLELVDNCRFLIRKNNKKQNSFFKKEEIPGIYNLGSQALSMGIKSLKKDWLKVTGTSPKLLITYVDCNRGYSGIVYKASNWVQKGMSTDSLYSKGKGVTKTSSKLFFVYPLTNNESCKMFNEFDKEYLRQNWEKMNVQAQYNYMPSEERKEYLIKKAKLEKRETKGLLELCKL